MGAVVGVVGSRELPRREKARVQVHCTHGHPPYLHERTAISTKTDVWIKVF